MAMKDNDFCRKGRLAIMTGNANPALALKVAAILGEDFFLPIKIDSHRDRECRLISVPDTRGCDVYFFESTNQPDRHLVEIEAVVGAIRRSAATITLVIPYLGYSRQDRRDEPRQWIAVNSIMRRLVYTGVDGLVFFHLHNPASAGIPEVIDPHMKVDPFNARSVILEYLQKRDLKKMTIASADVGGTAFVRSCWERLRESEPEVGFGLAYKVGSGSTGIKEVNVIGDFRGREVMFVDDMTTGGGTIIGATQEALKQGSKSVEAILVHPVLADIEVCHNLAESPIERIVVTDSLRIPERHREILGEKLVEISLDKLLALAVWHLHCDISVTKLFELPGYLESYETMQECLRLMREDSDQ